MPEKEELSQKIVHFGPFQVDLQAGELRRNGSKVRLQEQPFQVLRLLLARPGEVVNREELRATLWPADTFVDFDHGLNAAVKRLRDALGDSAENPRFVETLARRGYRFVGWVEDSTPAPKLPGRATTKNGGLTRSGLTKVAAALGVLAMGTGAGWLAARRVNPRVQISEQRLTANALDDPVFSAVLSPDSKYLAFADRSGLFLRVVATGETHSLAFSENLKMSAIGWFPDGNHILVTNSFESAERQSLWSLSVLGGGPRKLVENARCGAISPDGSQIAFIRGAGSDQEIWLASLQGGQPHRIITQDGNGSAEDAVQEQYRKIIGEPGEIFGPPVWSPDGSRFAFTRYVYHSGYGDGDVSIGVSYPKMNRIDFVVSNRRLGDSLAWTADGRLVYSLTEAAPNQRDSNLWAQAYDARTGKLFGEAARLTNGPDVKTGLSFSADGKHLTFLRRSSEPHVYVAEIERGADRLSVLHRFSLEEGRNLPFTWTADSKSLVFISDREGPFHLYKQSADQPAPEILADGKDMVMGARLNPDGSEVLFLMTPDSNDPAGRVRLMRVPVAGGTPQMVLQEPQIENIQCARLPSKVCLFSRNEAHAIRFFRFDPASGKEQELTKFSRTSELKFNWTLSSDGSMLALAAWRQGRKPGEIQILSLGTGKQRTLTLERWPRINSVDWAADSRRIWTSASDTSGTQALLLVDLHGKAKVMLQDALRETGWAIPAPDGKRIAVWQASGTSNAWLLQGF